MSRTNFYHVLGIDTDAAQREVKRAYRKMAMKYHPDRNPGDAEAEQKFKQAAEAYEVLGNADKRQIYDQFGVDGLDGFRSGSAPDFNDVNDIFSEFNEIFGEMFGFGKQNKNNKKQTQRRGADLRHDLKLDFKEAVFGTEKKIEIPRHATCDPCSGTGARTGTTPDTCSTCDGEGQVQHTQGFFTLSSTCPDCGGSGEIIEEHCEECDGYGYVEETREINVSIPAGVDTGTRLRLRDEGETGRNGGPRGDLYVFLDVRPSEHFERRGADLHYEASLNCAEAALGCELDVPTLEGSTSVVFEPGTQFGATKIIDGEGVERLESTGRGDLHVHAHVTIPEELDDEQRKLMSQLNKLMGEQRSATTKADDSEDSDNDEDSSDVDVLEPPTEVSELRDTEAPFDPPESRAVGRASTSRPQRSKRERQYAPTGE